jgi:hypothetical protein
MSMKYRNDGGAAFPMHVFADECLDGDDCESYIVSKGGMTLRDYFAGQALASFSGESRGVVVAVGNHRTLGSNTGMIEREARDLAEAAYAVADAMLKARQTAEEPRR